MGAAEQQRSGARQEPRHAPQLGAGRHVAWGAHALACACVAHGSPASPLHFPGCRELLLPTHALHPTSTAPPPLQPPSTAHPQAQGPPPNERRRAPSLPTPPPVPLPARLQGNAYAGLGDWAAAAENYGRATQLAPAFAFAQENRALALYQLGQDNRAIKEMRWAVEGGVD